MTSSDIRLADPNSTIAAWVNSRSGKAVRVNVILAAAPKQAVAVDAGAEEPEARVAEFREWTDATGEFTVVARLVEVRDNRVTLEKKSGEHISVALHRLSDGDPKSLEGRQTLKQAASIAATRMVSPPRIQAFVRTNRVGCIDRTPIAFVRELSAVGSPTASTKVA